MSKERKTWVVYEKPPAHIYDRAVEQFGVDWEDGVIFTYGDKIYTKNELPDHLFQHEMTHVRQQEKMGKDEWWSRYFADEQFRLEQEVEAYHNQFAFYQSKTGDRNQVFRFLNELASTLVRIYGLNLGVQTAMTMIKTGKINK